MRPTYRELLRDADPPGSAWATAAGGALGSLATQTPETVVAAAALVRKGAVFNLDYPVGHFDPPLVAGRAGLRHEVTREPGHSMDDALRDYPLQVSSHIDGLRHVAHPEWGFYGGHAWETATDPAVAGELGVSRWAETGVVGRGVLVDLFRHAQRRGVEIDWDAPHAFSLDDVREAAADAGIAFRSGDILLLHTGWAAAYPASRGSAGDGRLRCAGVAQSEEFVEWLWDTGFSVVAADNLAVEVLPARRESPFRAQYRGGLMHPVLLPLLGMALGELWRLEELAADCAADGVHECLVTASPLNLTGGVGSPANACAVK